MGPSLMMMYPGCLEKNATTTAAYRSGDRIPDKRAHANCFSDNSAQYRKTKRVLSLGYIISVAVSGMVLTAADSTLDKLAIHCGTSSTKVGTVFIAKGVGTGAGATICPALFQRMRGNIVLSVGLLVLAANLVRTPFASTVWDLHVVYFLLGFLVNIIITGCQIMTRKVHGDKSGIWIGTNMVVMGISSALTSLIGFSFTVFQEYAILSATSLSAAVILGFVLPTPEKLEGLLEVTSKTMSVSAAAGDEPMKTSTWLMESWRFIQKYSTEIHISSMLFWVNGGVSAATAYLSTYIEYTGVITNSEESLLSVDMWAAVAIGTIAGLLDQLNCTLPNLFRHAAVAFLAGGAALATVLVFDDSAVVLWVCMGIFGLSHGPSIGYAYELNNRVNTPSETGMSIVTFGLSFGLTAVPYATSLLLEYTGSATPYIVVLFLSKLMTYALLLNAMRLIESREHQKDSGWLDLASIPDSEATEETSLLG